jgi:hypothetical protein
MRPTSDNHVTTRQLLWAPAAQAIHFNELVGYGYHHDHDEECGMYWYAAAEPSPSAEPPSALSVNSPGPSPSKVIDFAVAANRFRAVQKRPRSPFQLTNTPIKTMAITQVAVETDGAWVPINLDGLPAKLNGRRLRLIESRMLDTFGRALGAATPPPSDL